MKLKLIILFSVLISCTELYAHAIWIETDPVGKKGQQQVVKIFLGEYAQNERDSIGKWFSNMKEFTIWLHYPNGQKQQLTTAPAADHFKTSFVPAEDGIYTLSINHEVAQVYGTSKIHYYAVAPVSVGNTTKGLANIPATTAFSLYKNPGLSATTGANIVLQASYSNAPLTEGKVTIASPEGWEKTTSTDQKGVTSFKPVGPGLYLVEAFYTDKTEGTHNGKEYKSVMHCVSYCLKVGS